MPRSDPVTDAERAELRRLYLSASPGTWEAVTVPGSRQTHLIAQYPDGSRFLLAMPNREADARLAAAARNALPRLFGEIDALRERRRIPVLGTVR